MPGWSDLGTAFTTLRELDVAAIRAESERPLTIGVFGPRELFSNVYALLNEPGDARYGSAGNNPFVHHPLAVNRRNAGMRLTFNDNLRRADLLLILVDGAGPVSASGAEALAHLGQLSLPTVIAVCGVASPGDLGQPRPEFAQASIVVLPDLGTPEAREILSTAILTRLPGELHLSASRVVPGLREIFARELISSVAFSNATFSFASAIPEQIPVLAVPFAAADIIVLTKNQALMVYRLALAHGAPPEFHERIAELAPVVGGAFVWRQVARTLVGLIPFWGIVPKVAVAYAGTYATGMAAWRWFADGELLSGERMHQITNEAMRIGRERANALVAAARERREAARARRTTGGGRQGLTWRTKPDD